MDLEDGGVGEDGDVVGKVGNGQGNGLQVGELEDDVVDGDGVKKELQLDDEY